MSGVDPELGAGTPGPIALSSGVTFARIFTLSRPLRTMPLFLRYLGATAVVFLFFGVRAMIEPALGGYPFLMFFPAIIFIALVFDRGTGVFAVLLSATLAWWFFIPPRGSFRVEHLTVLWPLILYVVIGLFLALVVEALRATAESLQATKTELEKAATLNALLLIDINHRVKNHLAAVTGLLRMSQREVGDPAARSAMEEAARRIDVLGKVYTRLHLGERATVVSAKDFLVSLCDDLRSGVVGVRPVALRCHSDDADIPASMAVPLGLIVNELVENALKHAFPNDRAGEIAVALRREGDGYRLAVRDDGVGFDPETARRGGGSRLVRSLAQQLGGRLEVTEGPGTGYEIHIPQDAGNGL